LSVHSRFFHANLYIYLPSLLLTINFVSFLHFISASFLQFPILRSSVPLPHFSLFPSSSYDPLLFFAVSSSTIQIRFPLTDYFYFFSLFPRLLSYLLHLRYFLSLSTHPHLLYSIVVRDLSIQILSLFHIFIHFFVVYSSIPLIGVGEACGVLRCLWYEFNSRALGPQIPHSIQSGQLRFDYGCCGLQGADIAASVISIYSLDNNHFRIKVKS
jgi:hypothetical protein